MTIPVHTDGIQWYIRTNRDIALIKEAQDFARKQGYRWFGEEQDTLEDILGQGYIGAGEGYTMGVLYLSPYSSSIGRMSWDSRVIEDAIVNKQECFMKPAHGLQAYISGVL